MLASQYGNINAVQELMMAPSYRIDVNHKNLVGMEQRLLAAFGPLIV